MGYLALLFCPDEKTARTVTHVLNDLDFTVEPCTEPFAAVKKLMAQHFDAVVVDCDNEQNATLLFKSARNSASNQSSLAVAVVEGQAGVAKAFRIGANLVLTRPINVEQAKGTLRVARGLLRKGAEAKTAKPATPTASIAAPSIPSSTTPPPRPTRPTPPSPPASSTPAVSKSAPKFAPAPKRLMQAAPPIAARAMDVVEDHEPDTILDADDAEILDVPSAPAKPQLPATPAAGTSKFPWQPAKPMAEPMGSALRRAAEVAARIESANTEAPPRPSGFTSSEDRLAASAGMSRANAAASAPAPAKDKTVALPPVFAEPIVTKAPAVEIGEPKFASEPAVVRATKTIIEPKVVEPKAEEPPATSSERSYYTPAHEEPAPPTFFPGAYDPDEAEGGSNVKAIVIVAMVVLLACSAGYLSWRNMNGKGSPVAQPAQTAPASAPTSAAPKPGAGQPSDKPSAAVEPETTDITLGGTSSAGTTHTATKPSPKTTAPAAETDTDSEPEVTQRLIVKNEPPRTTKPAAAQQPEAVQEPTGIALGAAPDPKALAGLSTGPANTPKPTAQVIKVSQGVMEGLLLKRVQPRYPAQAMQMRIQGAVQLQATISKTGDITNLKIVSGDGILARSAQEAVKQWKYKPYYLNGDPVEIQTQILVNFKLPN
jgi:protein TonB